jgi:glutamine---fructose-6-phosphate transaminase (isomerizing)
MCGIVGYTGQRQAQGIILNSLARLEYRGYDSCGIALKNGGIAIYKDAVRVAQLSRSLPEIGATVGIGHTRWATHGAPNRVNAHPHADCTGRLAVVHNGVISNYLSLRKNLISRGHRFVSETDTEVIAHLIEEYYQGNLREAVDRTVKDLEGSYAIIAMCGDENSLVFARKDSPLIIGIGDGENFLASDVPAVLDYTSRIIYLEDGDSGEVTPAGFQIFHAGKSVPGQEHKIQWSAEQAKKGGYEHFLLKEIHEQPRVLRDTIAEYFSSAGPQLDLSVLNGNRGTLLITACGTSFHAALFGKYIAEQLLKIPVRAEMASEFNYFQNVPPTPIAIGITQSGETADTLKAMKRLKESGSRVVAISNIFGSTATRIADMTVYTRAGLEMSVAATKTFTAQLAALFWLIACNADRSSRRIQSLVQEFRRLPEKMQQVLDREDQIAAVAVKMAEYEDIFYIGRGINYPIVMEGALKLKEVSYIHCEACAAGEMKHGTFALLDKNTPVLAIVARDGTRDSMLTSIKEIKARGSPVFVLAPEGDDDAAEIADTVLTLPSTEDLLTPFVNAVAVQLITYFAARQRGCPIDFPRNLAKSVTVE